MITIPLGLTQTLLHNKVPFLCLQHENTSFLEFNSAKLGLNMIWYASLVQSWHTILLGENGFPLSIAFHSIS